jgi:hypothetical protein
MIQAHTRRIFEDFAEVSDAERRAWAGARESC